MKHRRWLGVLLGVPVVVASALTTARVTGGSSAPSPHYEPDTSCDVDGVETGYDVAFADTSSDYRVTHVDLRSVSPTCAGGTATVILSRAEDGTELGRGEVELDDSSAAKIEIATPASAKETTKIRVELAGGKVPVPAECEAADMGFDEVLVGEVGDDQLHGISRRDLLFALPGDDTVDGLPGEDCLDGGTGDDRLRGNEGDDVLVGGEGADFLDGETGRDTLHGGVGNDDLRGGVGDDVIHGGDGNDTIVGGVGKDVCMGGPGTDTFVSCETVVQD